MCNRVSGEALYQWRQWAIKTAQANDVTPDEVDWLLQGLSTLSSLSLRLSIYRDQPDIWLKTSIDSLTHKWHQRISNRVPVQYLTGETPWRNFSLTVSPDVLIPRPETELIIDIAQVLAEHSPIAHQLQSGHWADLGTGSGAIALGLSQSFPAATIHAVDISEQALAVARLNVQQNDRTARIAFHWGSWLSPLTSLQGRLAGIVANPPYIPSQTLATLQPEVTRHEPHLALDGGSDGLESIRCLVSGGTAYLQPGGIWLIELMAGQAESVARLLAQHSGYANIVIHLDLAGTQRFVSACKAL